MAITPNTTFSSGAVLTADQMNRLPWGIIKYEDKVANQTGITTVTDITDVSATWTADSTRIYRTTLYLAIVSKQTSAGDVSFYITDGSNVAKAESYMYFAGANTYLPGVTLELIESGLSGSVTRKGRMSSSPNAASVEASSTRISYIIVEDIGKA